MQDQNDSQREYAPAGEAADLDRTFQVAEIAEAFGVEQARVERAVEGEFGAGATIDSRAVQHLAEVLLVDQPLAEREAAMMVLGAFTPRPDHQDGLGENDPENESDRLVRNADRGDEERGE
jgi:hypothetical protein